MARRGKTESKAPKTTGPVRGRRKKAGLSEKGAIEILEEAFHLLRLTPLSNLTLYYLGAVPFVIGLLYFWGDMSRSAFAQGHLAPASLGLAVLFVWMKCWQAVFCQNLTAKLQVRRPPRFNIKRFWRLIVAQSFLQATGFIVMPLASILFFPLPWAVAYYQSLTVLGDGDHQGKPSLSRDAWEQAKLWPGQNNWMLSILFLFSLFVLANIIAAMFAGPFLLKSLLGIDTAFTRSGPNALNTTFWAVVFALTYLVLDPVVKAVYVLRCFYGASISSGLDLKVELSAFKAGKNAAIVVLAAIMLALGSGSAAAEPTNGGPPGQTVSPPELSQNIRDVLEQREYSWRLPREKGEIFEEEKPKGFLAETFSWLWEKTKDGARAVGRWLKKVGDWWDSLFPKRTPSERPTGTNIDWRPATKALLYIALAAVALILAVFVYRYLQSRRPAGVVKAAGLNIEPVDLEDENLVADQKSGDEWLEMAREMMKQGDFRLALRALYLANLARLAEQEMIAIARYKTNRDYLTELARRTPNDPEIRDAFSQNVELFDRVWYGRYSADRDDVETFARRQDFLLAKVSEQFGPPVIPPALGESRV